MMAGSRNVAIQVAGFTWRSEYQQAARLAKLIRWTLTKLLPHGKQLGAEVTISTCPRQVSYAEGIASNGWLCAWLAADKPPATWQAIGCTRGHIRLLPPCLLLYIRGSQGSRVRVRDVTIFCRSLYDVFSHSKSAQPHSATSTSYTLRSTPFGHCAATTRQLSGFGFNWQPSIYFAACNACSYSRPTFCHDSA